MRRLSLVVAMAAALAPMAVALAAMPVFPEFAEAEFYGQLVLDSAATNAGVPAVTFDHWQHRAIYSCRVCHADIAFSMKAGETGISAASNRSGLHCGACHNGRSTYKAGVIFGACDDRKSVSGDANCRRCHTIDRAAARTRYREFTARLPKDRSGLVDWEAAESRGLIKPIDFVEGVSFSKSSMKIDRDVPIAAIGTWLGNVTFSHKKHAAWNGCEVCHPEIFPSTKRGTANYDMAAIRAGRYCGVCHNTVAFPIAQCQKCHSDRGAATPFR